jgi:16S rRNA (guanine527-N7)-methyltransferase
VDSIGKKISVVKAIAENLALKNVTAEQARAEQLKGEYDFVVSRAVTRLKEFYGWIHRRVKKESIHDLDNGVLYLKGGDLDEELRELKKPHALYSLSDYFTEEFFQTKKVVYIPV